MTNPLQFPMMRGKGEAPTPLGPDVLVRQLRENLADIRAQGGGPDDLKAEIERWRPAIQAYSAQERAGTAGEASMRSFQSLLDAFSFGTAGIAADALTAKTGFGAQGRDVSFRQLRDERLNEYDRMPPTDRIGSTLAGAMLNPVSLTNPVLGPMRVGQPLPMIGAGAGANTLRAVFRGGAEGAAQGLVSGAGEGFGSTEGMAPRATAGGIGGFVLGSVIGPVAGRAARVGGGRVADPLHPFVPDALGGRGMRERRLAELAEEEAGRRLAAGREADQSLRPPPTVPRGTGMPPFLAMDEVGPATLGYAKEAATTNAGRDRFVRAFEERASQMPTAVTEGVPDMVAVQQGLEATRAAHGDVAYTAAEDVTKGVPIDHPLLNEFLATPAGQAAWRAVQAERPNVVFGAADPARALPTRTDPITGDVWTMPDAEGVNRMMQYLANAAKMEPGQVTPEGVTAGVAVTAQKGLARIRDALPGPFQAARDIYSAESKPITAIKLGRRAWKGNPDALNRKAGEKTLTRVEAQMQRMDPAEQGMVRQAKQYDIAQRIRNLGLSIPDAAAQLRTPGSDLAREFAIAGGEMPERIGAWNAVTTRQRSVLGDPNAVLTPHTLPTDLPGVAADVVAPTMGMAATKAGRRMWGGVSARELAARERAGGQLADWLTSDRPTTLAEALARLAGRDMRTVQGVTRGAGTAGRTFGASR